MRLDQYVALHYGLTRNRSQQCIALGLVSVNGHISTKSSLDVSDAMSITLADDRRIGWVSRSAEKLAGFIEKLSIDNYQLTITGTNCLDVGSSTG